MKKLLLFLLVLFFSIDISAQNPDIIGTWYFSYFTGDLGNPYPLMPGDAPQNPYIIINSDYTFEGIAACNTFSGDLNFNGEENSAIVENFMQTTNTCDTSQQTGFESSFFLTFDEFLTTDVFSIGVNQNEFLMESFTGFGLKFQDTVFLSIEDNLSSSVAIFPNPTSNNLSINTNGFSISEISIYTSKGRLIASEIYNGQTIDVSSLNSGIYFLELFSEGKKTVKKFIKE
ncbi:MAG: T9SS type A sorting domain-containing protein [Patiriisocius sp.]|uniref:T9SS type A sorting domain-containing protein n=1 Tax=Patiriisocius sp. TaxID=2822396 RepID=UPI003EF38B90